MRFWVGITDRDWFRFLAAKPGTLEVNFWQPSAGRRPVTLDPERSFSSSSRATWRIDRGRRTS